MYEVMLAYIFGQFDEHFFKNLFNYINYTMILIS